MSEPEAPAVKVLVADDHKLFAQSLSTALRPRYGRVENVQTLPDLSARLKRGHFDLVILDLTFGGKSSLDDLPTLVQENPDTRFLILTASAQRVLVATAQRAGAIGFVIKEAGIDDLHQAIELGLRGEGYVSRMLERSQSRSAGMRRTPTVGNDSIQPTGRELQVLQFLHAGYNRQQTANRLGIGIKTVDYHLHEVGDRLGLRGIPSLVRWFEEEYGSGKLQPPPSTPDADFPS